MHKYTEALMYSVRQFFEGRTGSWIEKHTGIDQAKSSRIKNNKSAALDLDEISQICAIVKADPLEILAQIYHPGEKGRELAEIIRLAIGCDDVGRDEISKVASVWNKRNKRKTGLGQGGL